MSEVDRMDLLGRSWKIGVCPICQRQGIGWCAGGIGDAHDTASIEVVEVIPASQLAGAVEALRPFVEKYDVIDRLHCPEFNGPIDLAMFEAAAAALNAAGGQS